MKKENDNYNFQDAYLKMMEAKEHHRTIEKIVYGLKKELVLVKGSYPS